jgi:hypothetical protein
LAATLLAANEREYTRVMFDKPRMNAEGRGLLPNHPRVSALIRGGSLSYSRLIRIHSRLAVVPL